MNQRMRSGAELLAALEALSLKPDEFHHDQHLHTAWQLLQTVPFEDAVGRFVGALKQLAAHVGAPGKYHESITLFYLHLVNARRQSMPASHQWHQFVERNPDLFDAHPVLIGRYYSERRLASAVARHHFVQPDRLSHEFSGGIG